MFCDMNFDALCVFKIHYFILNKKNKTICQQKCNGISFDEE
jgi:hypothetical protein